MLRHLLQMPWHLAYHSVTPYNSAASRDVFLIPKISYIIRHCKFVFQGACIFLKKKKKRKTTCSFQIGTKNPTKKKFIVEPSFFTSWTITSEKCTRAHVQENKSIYLSIYLSVWKRFWKRVYIYIYKRRLLRLACGQKKISFSNFLAPFRLPNAIIFIYVYVIVVMWLFVKGNENGISLKLTLSNVKCFKKLLLMPLMQRLQSIYH